MNYRRLVIIVIGSILVYSPLQAQQFSKMFLKFNSLHNMTYQMIVKEKDLFSDKINKDTLKADFVWSNNKESFKVLGTNNEEIFDGNKLIQMDLSNHTYKMASGSESSIYLPKTLPSIIGSLKQDVLLNKPTIQRDTAIDGKQYHKIKITEIDTIEKSRRVYRIIQVLIDKEKFLPAYYKSEQTGFVDGTDMFIDTYSEIHFFNYKFNQNNFEDLSTFIIPSDFVLQKSKESKQLLGVGTKAPKLNLKNLAGDIFDLHSEHGKLILLNFTTNSCPHGIESVSMLNDLYSKYPKDKFLIVTINPYDDEQAIENYNKSGTIKYPIFINEGTQNLSNYNVQNFPTFYLISKNGDIIKGFSGYDKSLDNALNKLIKVHL